MPEPHKRQNRTISRFLATSRRHLGLLGSLLMAGGIGASISGTAIADVRAEARPTLERRAESGTPSTSSGLPARHPVERMP